MQDARMQRIAAVFVGIILVLFVFIVGTAVIYYPGMIKAVEQIDQDWTALHKIQQQLITGLEQAAKMDSPPEPELLAKAVASGKTLAAIKIDTQHAPPFPGQLVEFSKAYQAHQELLLAWMVALEEKGNPSPFYQKIQQQIMERNLERSRYNQAVQRFNQKANTFPVNIISGRLGFGARSEL